MEPLELTSTMYILSLKEATNKFPLSAFPKLLAVYSPKPFVEALIVKSVSSSTPGFWKSPSTGLARLVGTGGQSTGKVVLTLLVTLFLQTPFWPPGRSFVNKPAPEGLALITFG